MIYNCNQKHPSVGQLCYLFTNDPLNEDRKTIKHHSQYYGDTLFGRFVEVQTVRSEFFEGETEEHLVFNIEGQHCTGIMYWADADELESNQELYSQVCDLYEGLREAQVIEELPVNGAVKYDNGKSPVDKGLFSYFPRALLAVADVSAFGAKKYDWEGWLHVEDGFQRYKDAQGRHMLKRHIEGELDSESQLNHLAHDAWNALATLELYLRNQK